MTPEDWTGEQARQYLAELRFEFANLPGPGESVVCWTDRRTGMCGVGPIGSSGVLVAPFSALRYRDGRKRTPCVGDIVRCP